MSAKRKIIIILLSNEAKKLDFWSCATTKLRLSQSAAWGTA